MPIVISGETRREDTKTFRYYEMAGTAHVTVHKDVGLFSLNIFLEDFCAELLNTLADGPVFGSFFYNAMWENMERQVLGGPAAHNRAGDPVGDAPRGLPASAACAESPYRILLSQPFGWRVSMRRSRPRSGSKSSRSAKNASTASMGPGPWLANTGWPFTSVSCTIR